MADRPMVATYDCETGLVEHREMDDDELAELKAREAQAALDVEAEATAPHPLIAQVESMTEADKAALREVLSA